MTAPRHMPTPDAVRAYWAPVLVSFGKFDSVAEALDADLCFACGVDGGKGSLERSHITARCDGGPDTVDNLHMLCSSCHKASEGLVGESYWVWLASRTFLDRAMQVAAAAGINLGRLVALAGGAA